MPDIYTYPNSEVLRNKYNVKDSLTLNAYERKNYLIRLHDISNTPIEGNFDLKHLQRIHKHLFGNVYEWAGEIRKIDIGKIDSVSKQLITFCPTEKIEGYAEDIFRKLKKDNYLKNTDAGQFAKKAAELMGEINTIHPFREGNGRTQRYFMIEVARNAGYELSFENVNKAEMVEASIAAHKMNYQPLYDIIRSNIKPLALTLNEKTEHRISEILASNSQPEINIKSKPKEIYDHYAKKEISIADHTKVSWEKVDRKIMETLVKEKASFLKIESVVKNSPAFIGKTKLEAAIQIRQTVNQIKKDLPELKSSLKR